MRFIVEFLYSNGRLKYYNLITSFRRNDTWIDNVEFNKLNSRHFVSIWSLYASENGLYRLLVAFAKTQFSSCLSTCAYLIARFHVVRVLHRRYLATARVYTHTWQQIEPSAAYDDGTIIINLHQCIILVYCFLLTTKYYDWWIFLKIVTKLNTIN